MNRRAASAVDGPLRVLAIETSGAACSVALWRDGTIIERRQQMQRGHAEALMPMLMGLLAEAGCRFSDLQCLAVTVGPGAFTGLRVGLAAARGIALAARLPCFGVSTLQAVADGVSWEALGERPLAVAFDTRRGDLFAELFARGDPVDGPFADTADRLAARLAGRLAGRGPALVGDGAGLLGAALAARAVEATELTGDPFPSAGRVAAIAARRWQAGDRPLGPPAPLYLHAPAVSG